MKFPFFWGHRPQRDGLGAGCLSQWWPAAFTLDAVTYPTAEHFMMHCKALLFGDDETAARVLTAAHSGAAKTLGRQVRGFDETIWETRRYDIVVAGNTARFGQHPRLRDYLFSTRGCVLVEASPLDRVWGIGLVADDLRAAHPPQAWPQPARVRPNGRPGRGGRRQRRAPDTVVWGRMRARRHPRTTTHAAARLHDDAVSDTVHTVAVAALTSGIVALVIEYAAKPWLEVRKERILDRLRARDDLRKKLLNIVMLAKMLDHDRLPSAIPATARSRMLAQQERFYQQLVAEVEQLMPAMTSGAITYVSPIISRLYSYAGIINGIMLSERTRAEKGRVVVEATEPLLSYLSSRWFRPIQRLRSWFKVDAFLRGDAGSTESNSDTTREIASPGSPGLG
ncbi:hypothetical protein Raf01_95220 [Rugosimonospora africana]|uniref:NADAR domain-containing protein n=2 Tax=Rugosimonospora africana TaxID=556532 RepID=A0A8J3R4U9_9ACTN|nr:hypothetical protein Raf01_95220 [Rugosimonospora africana]